PLTAPAPPPPPFPYTTLFRSVSPPASDAAVTKPLSLVRVAGGVKPPRVIDQPEPSFSEPARRAKYQGVVVLWLVVGRDGLPTEIDRKSTRLNSSHLGISYAVF